MAQDFILQIANEGILLLLVISGPPIIFSLIVGLIIALFQAVTQVQEQSLTFVPKIVVMFLSVLLFLPYILTTLTGFTHFIFDRIVAMG